MQTEVMEKCDMLVENRNIIYKGFMLEDSLMQVLAAMSFVDRGETADVKAIKRCRKILRKKHSAFSYLRGNNELFISSKMALSDDPEKALKVFKCRIESDELKSGQLRMTDEEAN